MTDKMHKHQDQLSTSEMTSVNSAHVELTNECTDELRPVSYERRGSSRDINQLEREATGNSKISKEEVETNPKMRFDSLFPIIGDFGRYQKRVYLLLCLPAICCAMHKLAWVFLGAKLEHRYFFI